MRRVPKGSISNVLYFMIRDTAGAAKTGLAFGTSGLVAWYVRDRAAPVSITLITQTATGAYSSGGFIEVDATKTPGLYRLDVPNAAFVDGSSAVRVEMSGASINPTVAEYELYEDSIAAHTGLAQAGATNTVTLASTASAIDNTYKNQFADILQGTGAGQSRFVRSSVGSTKVATVFPNWVTPPDTTSLVRVRHFGLDATDADALIDLIFDELLSTHVVPGSLGARLAMPNAGTAQAGGAATLTLAAAAPSNDEVLKDVLIFIIAGTAAGCSNVIASYNGTSKVATMRDNWPVTPNNTSVYITIPQGRATLAQESVDRVLDAPLTKPLAVPTSWTLRACMAWLTGRFSNKALETADTLTIRDDTDSIDIAAAPLSDVAGTFTRGKFL